jgi:predicted cupin superfamily sugar epimerase
MATKNAESFAFQPTFGLGTVITESPETQDIIDILNLRPHIEGGYFVRTDKDKSLIPNPFFGRVNTGVQTVQRAEDDNFRAASSSIIYLLISKNSQGFFHRNHCRIIHTLHRGRGRYVVIHADEVEKDPDNPTEEKRKARIETFVVGNNVKKGEKLQWIVKGGKYKASYLLPDADENQISGGLLISEVSRLAVAFDFVLHVWKVTNVS